MKRSLVILGAALLAAGLLSHDAAEARGGRPGGRGGWHSGGHFHGGFHGSHGGFHHHRSRVLVSGGFFVGAPLFGPPYYPAYAYYPPPYSVAPPQPTYYVEKTDGYWYYCTEAGRYYPDVQTCASPWVKVPGWQTSAAP